MITTRKQKFAQQQQKKGRESSVAMSTSSFNHILRLEADNMNMFSEQDMTLLIVRLVELFARL